MPEGQVDPHQSSRDGNDLSNWLEHLRVLMPPRGVAHVGAGAGAELATYERWAVTDLALIEADAALAKKLTEAVKGREGWVVHPVLVDQAEGERSFFVASNPRESGLLPAEALHSLWRNLRRTGERSMPAVNLDSLLPMGDDATGSDINWLVLDCLPAATVLAGAQALLKRCDVVVARVALRDGEALAHGETLTAAAEILFSHGFEQVAVEEERMPLVGRALFVRKPRSAQSNDLLQKELLQKESSRESDEQAVLEVHHRVLLEAQQRAAALDAQFLEYAQRLADTQTQLDEARAGHDQARQSEAVALEQLAALRTQLEAEHQPLQQELQRLQDEMVPLKASAAERDQLILKLGAVRLELTEAEQAHSHQVKVSAEQIEGTKSINLQLGAERNALLEFKADAIFKLMRLQTSLDERDELKQQAERRVAACEAALKTCEESGHLSGERLQALAIALEAALESASEQKALAATAERDRQVLESRLALVEEEARSLVVQMANERDAAETKFKSHATTVEVQQRKFELEMVKAEAQIALIRDVLLRPQETDGSDTP